LFHQNEKALVQKLSMYLSKKITIDFGMNFHLLKIEYLPYQNGVKQLLKKSPM
jgi:hypothetical protein